MMSKTEPGRLGTGRTSLVQGTFLFIGKVSAVRLCDVYLFNTVIMYNNNNVNIGELCFLGQHAYLHKLVMSETCNAI